MGGFVLFWILWFAGIAIVAFLCAIAGYGLQDWQRLYRRGPYY